MTYFLGKSVHTRIISRKPTEGALPASSSLTTSNKAIWHPFKHGRNLLSIYLFVWESVCNCVTLPAYVQWTRQQVSSVIHVNTVLPWFIDLTFFYRSVHREHSKSPGRRLLPALYSFVVFLNRYTNVGISQLPWMYCLYIHGSWVIKTYTDVCYWIFYRPRNIH